jgi:hypothetical protein
LHDSSIRAVVGDKIPVFDFVGSGEDREGDHAVEAEFGLFTPDCLFEEGVFLGSAQVLVEGGLELFHAEALSGGREGGREREIRFCLLASDGLFVIEAYEGRAQTIRHAPKTNPSLPPLPPSLLTS